MTPYLGSVFEASSYRVKPNWCSLLVVVYGFFCSFDSWTFSCARFGVQFPNFLLPTSHKFAPETLFASFLLLNYVCSNRSSLMCVLPFLLFSISRIYRAVGAGSGLAAVLISRLA